MGTLSNLFNSKLIEVQRSQINPSKYNPRTISKEGKQNLKRSLKKYGVLGGIIVNAQTGNTIVGGHQKVAVLDEINKYPTNDYTLRVELINVDEKTEKEINVVLNNPNVGGDWDYDKLREIIPDIDYKDVGLTDADLSMIGCDFLFQTPEEVGMADELNDLMTPINEEHKAELEQKQLERQATAALEREEKIQAMKDLKAEVKEKAMKDTSDMDAYFMVSFSTYEAKCAFMEELGYSPLDKFIKGEDFLARLNGEGE